MFTDGSRMPGYIGGFLPFTGEEGEDDADALLVFGHGEPSLRDWERITEHIGSQLHDHGPATAAGEGPQAATRCAAVASRSLSLAGSGGR
ncbi:hypothetical protein NKH18_45300 [Streptomyces sp. M10(2022)]